MEMLSVGYGRKVSGTEVMGMTDTEDLASSWIVNVDSPITLTCSEQNQKYDIPTAVKMNQHNS